MTVQELIDTLNKIKDKTLDIFHYDHCDCSEIEKVDICKSGIVLY